MRFDLLPIFQNEQGIKQYLVTNFRRIQDGLSQEPSIRYGTATVTGTSTIATGLTSVVGGSATFVSDPSPEGCFVSAAPSGTDLIIKVFKLNWPSPAGFLLSDTPKNISWVAYGVL